jgi:BlaI family transcriptional regulator, penicillinase repressor
MARKKSGTLTEAEVRLMNILWEKGEATVGDVVDALPARQTLAYNTVLTTMRILEQKGYVKHHESGRAFVYSPLVDRSAAQRSAVKQLVSRFFQNSPGLLALNVLENEKLDAAEVDRLKRLIKASEAR